MKTKCIKTHIMLTLYAIMMSFLCIGSSPILDYMDPDSQNFRLIGRALARGQVAYIDIFDHKGPYVYLIEYLAALISPHSEWGIFLIEILFYSISICVAYEIAKMFLEEKEAIIASMAFLGLSFNFFTFVTGNLTDSYSVTFQIITLFFVIKYYKSGDVEHPPIYMFVYALTACLSGLMRPVNAGGWIPLGIILAIRLFCNKRIRNFFQNLLALILGVIVGVAPALVYGVRHNCIEEMWYGTFLANMKYAKNASETQSFGHFLKEFIFAPEFIIVVLALVSVVIVIKKSNDIWASLTFAFMFVAQLLFMNVSLRNNGQYNQLYVVYTLPVILVATRAICNKIAIPVTVCAIVLLTLVCNLQLIKQITKYGDYHYHYEAACAMKDIIDDPYAKVMVTGANSVYYNVTDTVSHIKYFIIYGNGLHYDVFPDAVNMQSESILSGENDYVVVVHYGDNIFFVPDIDKQVEEYLLESYSNVYELPEIGVVLYKKKVDA